MIFCTLSTFHNSTQEFLWVPCSLVQPLGDDATSVEVMHGGLVTVLSVRVNINIKTETVEELVAKKKSMHIAAMKAMIDDLGQDLKSISESEAFKERFRKDGSIHYSNSAVIVEHIIQQCRLVLQRHEERDALEFVNDKIYRCLVMQLLDCKSWAKEKLQLWLHDNAEYWEGRFGIKKETLVASHRMWLALQRRLIARAASESLAAQASTVFLQSQGLILQNVAEDTFDDEPIARAAGANGWSLENITALKVAGGDLNATYSNGWTSLLYGACCFSLVSCFICHLKLMELSAARYGATSTVSALIECGAHVNARNSQDESAIILASRSGIASVIKVLAAAKADPNDCDHREGWTCLIW